MKGKILNTTSLKEMLSWKTEKNPDPEFFPIAYGLGIFRIETNKGIAYMHSGDAVGYYANMLYFPSDETTVVYAVNSNYGKIDEFVSTKKAMEKIIAVTK
jgi:D-alanyl-D-alanine carboxypeptidase